MWIKFISTFLLKYCLQSKMVCKIQIVNAMPINGTHLRHTCQPDMILTNDSFSSIKFFNYGIEIIK